MSREQFDKAFPTSLACKEHLARFRWGDQHLTPPCPRCGGFTTLTTTVRYRCLNSDSRYCFNETTLTPFHATRVLLGCYTFIYLMSSALTPRAHKKNGYLSKEISVNTDTVIRMQKLLQEMILSEQWNPLIASILQAAGEEPLQLTRKENHDLQ